MKQKLKKNKKVFWKKVLILPVIIVAGLILLSGCSIQYDHTLSSLEIPLTVGAEGELKPDFSPTTFEYTMDVPNDITSIQIIVKAKNNSDNILVNGLDLDDSSFEGLPENSASVNLNEGKNLITIDVGTSDIDKKTYKVTINREDMSALREKFEKFEYKSDNTGITMPYRLYIPESYNEDSDEKYPIVMALHGAGERGTDNEAQLTANLLVTKWATDEVQDKQEMFVLAPQSRDGDGMGFGITSEEDPYAVSDDAQTAKEILDLTIESYNIDTDRVYGVGLSQGGFGTWALDLEYPDMYTAIVPIASGGDPDHENLEEIVDQPIWSFHAAADPVVSVEYDRAIVEKLKSKGSNIKYTEYLEDDYFFPDAHFSWVPAMHDEELVDWLLAQSK